jgi:hypothetical protein
MVKKKMARMKEREVRKPYMFYPEDTFTTYWELLVTLVLLYTSIATPARIAFVEEETFGWSLQKWLVDGVFFLDICIIFNTAYQDEDFKTIDDRKSIAEAYVCSWFFIDVLSIAPFEFITRSSDSPSMSNINSLVRLTKIGRITKMMKLTKLLRVLKIIK